MTVAAEASLEERVQRVVEDAVAARRGELEAWLRDAGLARVTSAGLLVPTERGVEIANALAS